MDRASFSDLIGLDRDALIALILANEEKIASLTATRDAELRRLEAELDSHRETLAEQSKELSSRSDRIEHLKLVVEKLRHVIFGTKSEKLVIKLEQFELELEDMETTEAELEAAADRGSPEKERKARSRRKPLPDHLPREVVAHAPNGDCCPGCGGALRQFGEDVSEQLEYIPESFKVIRHVRPKFSCTGCERIVESSAPSRPIDRGLAGPALLAHVIVSKFCDHLPLFRQSEIYARQGVDISRSTMAGWWVRRPVCFIRWWTRFAGMCSPAPSSMPTIRRCRSSRPVAGRPRLDAFGLTYGMTGRLANRLHQLCGSLIRKIARVNIHASI